MLQPTSPQAPRGLLPKGARFRGDILVAQGLRIEGEVHGSIRTLDGDDASTVIVAEDAVLVGSLEAPHVVVHGLVKGPIVASQSLQLQAGAQVEGELRYRHLVLHPQALVRGVLIPMLGPSLDSADAVSDAGESESGNTESAAPAREAEAVPQDAEADNGPNHDAGKPETDLHASEDAVPSRPNPA